MVDLFKPLPNNKFTVFTYVHSFTPLGNGLDGWYSIDNFYEKKFTGGGGSPFSMETGSTFPQEKCSRAWERRFSGGDFRIETL